MQKYAQTNARSQVRPLFGIETMMAVPPESSLARLLKLRRVHREVGCQNREREMDLSVGGNSESGPCSLALYAAVSSGWAPAKDSDVISIPIQLACRTSQLLHKTAKRSTCSSIIIWGRTGFDSSLEAQVACRGWFVGLVKNRTKKQTQTTKVSLSRLN